MTREEAFKATVEARINGDKNHGWGVEDSLAVIVKLVENEVGEAPDEAWQALARSVINPSAFRQRLEAKKLLNEQPKGTRKGTANVLTQCGF